MKWNIVTDSNCYLLPMSRIDECTRIRFIYSFEEHTPENMVKFFRMLQKVERSHRNDQRYFYEP